MRTEFHIQTTLLIPAGQLNLNLQAHNRQDNHNLNLNQSAFSCQALALPTDRWATMLTVYQGRTYFCFKIKTECVWKREQTYEPTKDYIHTPLCNCHAYCRWQTGVGNIQYSWFLWIWFPALASLLHRYDQPQLKPEPAMERSNYANVDTTTNKSTWTVIDFLWLSI